MKNKNYGEIRRTCRDLNVEHVLYRLGGGSTSRAARPVQLACLSCRTFKQWNDHLDPEIGTWDAWLHSIENADEVLMHHQTP